MFNPREGEEYYLWGEALVPQEALKAAWSDKWEPKKDTNSYNTYQDLRSFWIEQTSTNTGNGIGNLFGKK